ncbi:hypothetical protein B566_EDAN012474 [Ephemera danica]|nr:hypothetical protein B566_EDAN012474 [Ephemera danica]
MHQCLPAVLLLVLRVHVQGADPPLHPENRIPDHQVTLEQATLAARALGVAQPKDASDGAGCGRCSLQERLYCESPALLNDHCCCDTKLREPMSYAPHECWVQLPPAEPCAPVAENCAEYARVMDCCCKNVLLRKYYSGGAMNNNWVPYLLGEMFMTWIKQRPAAGSSAGEADGQLTIQQDALETEGHNRLVSGAQTLAGGLCYLLLLTVTLVAVQ